MLDNPKIRNTLKILEPTTFPRAMSLSPFLAATIEVTSSGREVPTATMVRPIRASLRPKALAISFAPFTVISPPIIIPASPTRESKILFPIEYPITASASCIHRFSALLFKASLTAKYMKMPNPTNNKIPSRRPKTIRELPVKNWSIIKTFKSNAATMDKG